jgi:hypothetical protein
LQAVEKEVLGNGMSYIHLVAYQLITNKKRKKNPKLGTLFFFVGMRKIAQYTYLYNKYFKKGDGVREGGGFQVGQIHFFH